MSNGPSRPETEPELDFELIEEPPPPPSPPPPPEPPPEPSPPPEPAPPPEPPPEPVEPKAVPAAAELHAEVLHRDRRGRIVGDRFAVLCDGEEELIQAIGTLSRTFSLADVQLRAADSWRLLVASAESMAREMLSSRLDAALDAFRLGGASGARLYVGGRGVFVPYTGRLQAWDVEGDLPGDGEPRLLDPERDVPDAWDVLPAADLLPRLGMAGRASGATSLRRRLREVPGISWVLTSERIFPALLSWARDAGLELSFAVLRPEDGSDERDVLLYVEALGGSDRKLLDGLPEVDLLWDPLVEADEDGELLRQKAEQVPPVLVDQGHELPVHLTAAPFLTDDERPVLFLAGRPPLVLAGPVPLTPGTALIRPQLADAPRRVRPQDGDGEASASLHLPLRLLRRRADVKARRTRALLLTPGDLTHLAILRDHLPWAVTSRAQMAQFAEVSFVLLGEEATWNLPIGLPYWGDDAEGVYLARGWRASPEVPASVVRRATGVDDGEVAFLSPARLWCVPRQAFRPLAERIELRRDLSRVRLKVEAARFDAEPEFPELVWPEEKEEVELDLEEIPRRPAAPVTRSRLLKEARAAMARGEHEKAAVLFERAGEFVQAAELYDRLVAS